MLNLIKLLLSLKIAFIGNKTLIMYKALRLEVSASEVKLYANGDLVLDAEHRLDLCPEETYVKSNIITRCDLQQPTRVKR